MTKITLAIHGLGNIGTHAIDCISTSPDLECIGVIRRPASIGTQQKNLQGVQDFPSLDALIKATTKPDAIIICAPSRAMPNIAKDYLARAINTVDSFDIHAEIPALVGDLNAVASEHGTVAVTAAGWDPGTDSALRAYFEAMVPTGTTFTNFGPGRSMGHSVAARNIEGVADALSITMPMGSSRHSRLVYIVPKDGASHDDIKTRLAADAYFCKDPLDVRFLTTPEELHTVADNSHGVLIERLGASGSTSNQKLQFDMRITNPALTAQVTVACARATTRLAAGCYTLIDIPPVALLPGERMGHIARLV